MRKHDKEMCMHQKDLWLHFCRKSFLSHRMGELMPTYFLGIAFDSKEHAQSINNGFEFGSGDPKQKYF